MDRLKVPQQKRGRLKAPQLRMRGSAHSARTRASLSVPLRAPAEVKQTLQEWAEEYSPGSTEQEFLNEVLRSIKGE